jgi:uncharacterized membrane protein (UPF0127 family)
MLADVIEVAASAGERMKGLLGRKELPAGQGLLIKKCNGIHMFFMRFVIDAVFLSKEDEVVYILRNFKPWRVSKIVSRAAAVLELPAGTLGNNVKEGDFIDFVV